MDSKSFILTIDQGTTSTRTSLINDRFQIVFKNQEEQENIYQNPGWCETDPEKLYQTVKKLCNSTIEHFKKNKIEGEIKCIGISNQRETCLIWNRLTGEPLTNAILWNDNRTQDLANGLISFNNNNKNEYQKLSGLPISSYFSALKFKWFIENNNEINKKIKSQDYENLCFGTIDSWLIFKLTQGKQFITDVTNASRTMLMNIITLDWDDKLLNIFDVPRDCLPKIISSSDEFGFSEDLDLRIPISGVLGDQQAACIGHCLFENEVKNTYGTGGFLLMNIENNIYYSSSGLLTTVLYRKKGEKVKYALEGAIEVAGNALTWLKNNMGVFSNYDEISPLFNSVADNGGVIFVPCFSGLFSPYWDNSARATIFGLTNNTSKGHLIRATFEAVSYRTLEIIKSFEKDTNVKVHTLKVDGGMTVSDEFLQTQSNILNAIVKKRPESEITMLGAAIAAAIGQGIINSIEEASILLNKGIEFNPIYNEENAIKAYKLWEKAVERARDWV